MKRNCSKLLIFCSGSARGLRSLGRQLHCRTSRSLVSLCEFNDEWVEVDLAASDESCRLMCTLLGRRRQDVVRLHISYISAEVSV